MDSTLSLPPSPSPVYLPEGEHRRIKILVAGPLGIGKTTVVKSLSQIPTLHTDEVMTNAAVATDDLSHDVLRDKTTTTVAIDFGRLRRCRATRSSFICTGLRGSAGSFRCGKESRSGRSAPSSWSTPGGSRTPGR